MRDLSHLNRISHNDSLFAASKRVPHLTHGRGGLEGWHEGVEAFRQQIEGNLSRVLRLRAKRNHRGTSSNRYRRRMVDVDDDADSRRRQVRFRCTVRDGLRGRSGHCCRQRTAAKVVGRRSVGAEGLEFVRAVLKKQEFFRELSLTDQNREADKDRNSIWNNRN